MFWTEIFCIKELLGWNPLLQEKGRETSSVLFLTFNALWRQSSSFPSFLPQVYSENTKRKYHIIWYPNASSQSLKITKKCLICLFHFSHQKNDKWSCQMRFFEWFSNTVEFLFGHSVVCPVSGVEGLRMYFIFSKRFTILWEVWKRRNNKT